MSDINRSARLFAQISSELAEQEEAVSKLSAKVRILEDKAVALDSKLSMDLYRIDQLAEDINSVRSSIRFATRTLAAVVGTGLFGAIISILSTGTVGS